MAEPQELTSESLDELAAIARPRWYLTNRVDRSRARNRVVLTDLDGAFGRVTDDDVSACNDGADLPTTVFRSTPAVLILDIDGRSGGGCGMTFREGDPERGTGDLTIQVRNEKKTFDDAVIPEAADAMARQAPGAPDKRMPTVPDGGKAQDDVLPWALNAGLIRNRPNLIVLTDGEFEGVILDDVHVWFNDEALRVLTARSPGMDSSRLLIRVKGRRTRDEEGVAPPDWATGDLTIQVRDDRKVFPGVEEEAEGLD
jgi:hypothetical protein